jgi:sulfite oxidase
MGPKVEMIWGKRRDIIVRDRLLFNAEPPGSALASAEITAPDAFYSRNHGPISDIARDEWRLTVDGIVANPLTLTCDELATLFTAYSVVATLACAGNWRAELLNVRPIPGKGRP